MKGVLVYVNKIQLVSFPDNLLQVKGTIISVLVNGTLAD